MLTARASLLAALTLAVAQLPSAGSVIGTIRVSVHEDALFTARGDTLFLVRFPEEHAKSITVERIGPSGTRSKRLPFPLAYYLTDLSSGAHGLYLGTSVIKRFTSAPDELVRVDPVTLSVRARARFPGSVQTLEAGSRMWATIGDGRVVRLDPATLRVVAAQRLLSAKSVLLHGFGLTKPALGLGSLWTIVGGNRTELVRLDPRTLAVRSRTRLSRGASLSEVVADRTHVYLVRRGVASVDGRGRLVHIVAGASLDAAAVYKDDLVGLDDAASALELLDADGRVTASTRMRDLSGDLAVGGDNAWFLGDGGTGNGVVHVRLP